MIGQTGRLWQFLSTLSLRRATQQFSLSCNGHSISIHALLAESDVAAVFKSIAPCPFLSTLSLRRATVQHRLRLVLQKISIHALLAESDPPHRGHCCSGHAISIHALLAESDLASFCKHLARIFISIHALLAESDCIRHELAALVAEFLSTLSLRRATWAAITLREVFAYFYPRSPCGERRPCAQSLATRFRFLSTLSLRRATRTTASAAPTAGFLSTLSLRRATP